MCDNGFPEFAREYLLNYVRLRDDENFGTPMPMSNAYGVAKEVTPISHRIVGVGNTDAADVGVFPRIDVGDKRIFIYSQLWKRIKLAPDAAREGVKDMAMDIEGVVTSGHDGHSIVCTHTTTDPTITLPYKETYDECVVSVKLTRIVVHSPTLGVIADWPEQGKGTRAKALHQS